VASDVAQVPRLSYSSVGGYSGRATASVLYIGRSSGRTALDRALRRLGCDSGQLDTLPLR
jgi:hypothetical protein